MPKNKVQIPEQFTSIEEIQDFWDVHSTADYWEEMEDVDMQLSPELKSKLELKKLYRLLGLSKQQIASIEEKANVENIDSRRLITQWVLERV
ncbi:hypothetical protein U27_05328 [Candidatus Vecturithrix granuli]|uniref:Uncharacterized protein n=1 Tax=Vecturithrix granuli TaxID=1499967 RepID=A0A081C199_VECG1|nr:hypothetical protein U27_05328 [Candidatus Vecturithrix granuli]